MKKISYCMTLCLMSIFSLAYLLLVVDSFYQEYIEDKFIYWGYPQWGWMYENPKVYLWFNLVYIAAMILLVAGGWYLWLKSRYKSAMICLLMILFSAGAFAYMPTYNWNKQFAVFVAERATENSRIPQGKWWTMESKMQRYNDASSCEKLKGYLGRGEWPGGYPFWGEYRVWLIPDFSTDTLGRRGMVFHGGNKASSPWGVDMGNDIVDFAIQLRQNGEPMEIDIRYDQGVEESIEE